MNVLVYNGEGTSQSSVHHALKTLRHFLEPYYAVSTVSAKALQVEPWMTKTSALVFPGGADTFYVRDCASVAPKIQRFVRQGGIYIGFCAGGYFGSSRCEFARGDPSMEVSGDRDLKFFPGVARGPAFAGFQYNSEAGTRAANIIGLGNDAKCKIYYNGGPVFVDARSYDNVEVLAEYLEPVDVPSSANNKTNAAAAVVLCHVGKGRALLTGPHPEFIPELLAKSDKLQQKQHVPQEIVESLISDDTKRLDFLQSILTKAGLNCNNNFLDRSAPNLTPLLIATDASHSKKLEQFKQNLFSLAGTHSSGAIVLPDKDEFKIFEGFQTNFAQASQELVGQEPNETAKMIILPGLNESTIPPLYMHPDFNMEKYFAHLNQNNTIGSLLLYGEVVTSTSTLLNDNKNLVQSFPHDCVLHVGTMQVSGRGRGGNIWVSPKGMTASTAVVTLPTTSLSTGKSASIVFVQYLAMLACCKAIFSYDVGYESMPVRIKWPNDLYILRPQYYREKSMKLSGTNPSDRLAPLNDIEPAYVKLAGLLVNTHFYDDAYRLLVGCGVNVSNPGPTTSLKEWVDILNEERELLHMEPLAPLENEKFLALYMNHLESYLKDYINHGPQVILPDYYKLWLHSNQIVTLTDHNNVKAVITGITEDYGFLVAKGIQADGSVALMGDAYHLQPDGNTFDIFKGLVSRKV